ncbi:11031_t:CDS:2 [Funneliformis geosporum]|nr:11031_t:CDS:2 [Funneliformis geosporum]
MALNSMYTHTNLTPPLVPLSTSIYSSRPTTAYTSSINNSSSTSPYYHQIQPPVLDQQSQAMAQPPIQKNLSASQWFNPTSMLPSSFSPYQPSNGPMQNIVGIEDNKPTQIQKQLYSQHNLSGHQSAPTLPPPQNQNVSNVHHGVDMSNSANMVSGRGSARNVTNSKRAAQNRAAQRAFRQRKDRYIKDLEAKAKELEATKKQVEALQKDKSEMTAIIRNLRNENAKLKGEEVVEDDNRHNGTNSGASSNPSYPHYSNSSSRNDEDNQVLEEPWLRHKESVRKEAMNRPGSGLTDSPPRGSGIVLPPGPNTDTTIEPFFRPDYRHPNSNSPSPPSSTSSDRNRGSYGASQSANGRAGYSSNEEDTDRVYDDLCELLKTRSRPALPQNIGMNIWPQPTQQISNQNIVSTANGSGTVVG